MNFHVGQKVVCIRNAKDPPCPGEDLATKDEIYTVRAIVDKGIWGIGLYLHEIHNPIVDTNLGRMERALDPDRFRPLVENKRKTDITIFKKMLTGVHGRPELVGDGT